MIANRFILKCTDENGDQWVYEGILNGIHPLWTEADKGVPLYLNETEAHDIAKTQKDPVEIIEMFVS